MEQYLITDRRYEDVARKSWGDKYIIIPSVNCKSLSDPVSYHPDMVLFKTAPKEYICAPDVFCEYETLLKPLGINLICGKTELGCNYPSDIAYNVLKSEKTALAKFSATDPDIISYLDAHGIKKINVSQGYSKCSVCAGDGWAITADEGICRALKNEGKDVLQIPPGEIQLFGYDYGFIGGASGISESGGVYFFGDLSSVSFGRDIYDFLCKKKIEIFQIKNYPLTDVGTIMFL